MSRHKYACPTCLNSSESEVPMQTPPEEFAKVLPCTNCGKIGLHWSGFA